jgi:hypothetical protein
LRKVLEIPAPELEGFSRVVECDLPGVKTFRNFVDLDVCRQLVEGFRARTDLTAKYDAEDAQHFNGRVFFTSSFRPYLRGRIEEIERRIAPLVEEHLAGFPVTAYGRPHWTEFPNEAPQIAWWPASFGMPFHHDRDHGRLHTALVPLTDDFEGGGTAFEKHKVIVRPGAGDLLIFDGSLMHGAATVTSGERFTLIMWFHRAD